MRIGDVTIDIDSIDPTRNVDKEFFYVDISSIDNKNGIIANYKRIRGSEAPSRARKVIKEKDIIVSTVRPNLNATAIVPKELNNQICSTGFAVLRSDGRILPEYLYFFTRTPQFVNCLLAKVKGASYPAVSVDDVKMVEISLPSIEQQASIVAKLRSAYLLKKKREYSNKLASKLLQATFLQMFGDPVNNQRKWNTVPLSSIATFSSGKAWKNEELAPNGMRIVRISNLHKEDFPYWHYSGKIEDKYLIKNGDLLFSWAGVANSIDVYIYQGDIALLNQHIYNIKLNACNFPKQFIFYVLNLHLNYLRDRLGGGVGQFHLKKSQLEQLAVIDPPFELKEKFILAVEKVREIQSKQAQSTQLITDLCDSLKQQAFKIELH